MDTATEMPGGREDGNVARERRVVQSVFFSNPDGYPPVVNGARLLAQDGFRVKLIGLGESRGVSYPTGVEIHRLQLGSSCSVSQYLGFILALLRLRGKKADLYVGHDMHGFLPAWFLSRWYRRPLVYHCHDFAENVKGSGRLVKIFEQLFARTAHLVIVPDFERGKEIARSLALKQQPLIVANAPLRRCQVSGEELRRTLAMQGRHYKRILLRQGRMGPGHALESTIRSLPLWTSREWGLVLIGLGEREYLGALESLAHELGVSDQLTILPPVSYDQILQLTPGADAGHALYEPIHINHLYATTASNKIMEYMAAGLPLLVSDRPSLRAFVDKYECGLTADEGSPESIAAAVNIVLGEPGLARHLGAAGVRAFEEELNYDLQFAPVLEAFRSLADLGRGGRA